MHYDSLVTQLVDLLWSVRIAEKVRMGLPCPRLVLVSASAMPVTNQRVVRLRGMMCGITRMSLACSVRSWDRAIPIRNNTWVNMVSDPMSCSRVVLVPVSTGIACHCLWTRACVCGIASARALCWIRGCWDRSPSSAMYNRGGMCRYPGWLEWDARRRLPLWRESACLQ